VETSNDGEPLCLSFLQHISSSPAQASPVLPTLYIQPASQPAKGMAELRQGYLSVPPVTRSLLTATAAVTLPPLLGLLSPYRIIFSLPLVRQRLELWRLVTPFFYAGERHSIEACDAPVSIVLAG